MWIKVRGERIEQINNYKFFKSIKAITKNTEIIDGTDKFIIPGLWDMHVHYWVDYKNDTPLLIANGVIGVRDMWGNIQGVTKIRQQIDSGFFRTSNIFFWMSC